MRKTNLKFLARVTLTVVAALFTLALSSHAQTIVPIFGPDSLSQSWQFYQAGNEPALIGGVNWKATNYNDSAWTPGFGVFAYEPGTPGVYPPINTTLNRTAGGAQIITYYFRTHFNFPANPTNATLYFTNLVDDGCVVYLNGFEIYRFRVTQATPVYANFASGGPAAEGTNEVFILVNSPRLRQGDNVLAVELHDTDGSTDAAFGVGVAYSVPEPILIKAFLADRYGKFTDAAKGVPAVDGDDIRLTVDVVGTNPRYWWFRNGVFLTGQTSPTLIRNNITPALAGTYHCVVSNVVGGARTANCVITVVPDTFGPRIIDAYVRVGETNKVFIQLNEDLVRLSGTVTNVVGGVTNITTINTNRSGQNPTNYYLTYLGRHGHATGGVALVVTQAIVSPGNAQVLLTANTNFNFNTNYLLCVSNVCDSRTGTNLIAWNSCVPIGFEDVTNVLEFESWWLFHTRPECLDETNWTAVDYIFNPSHWPEGQGMFYYDFAGVPNASCAPANSIPGSLGFTHYYRNQIVMPTNLVGIRMDGTLRWAVNDGAIFYLNGKEIHRDNMPAGPITCTTRSAVSRATEFICRPAITLRDLVFERTNILAVEVHQFADVLQGDETVGFGAQLDLEYLVYPRFTQPTNTTLRITNHSPTHVRVFFTNGFGVTIQSKTNLDEPWREVQLTTNNLITPKAATRTFYRLEKAH